MFKSVYSLLSHMLWCLSWIFLVIKYSRPNKTEMFGHLVHLEVSSPQFSKPCMEFVISNALKIESIKVSGVRENQNGEEVINNE